MTKKQDLVGVLNPRQQLKGALNPKQQLRGALNSSAIYVGIAYIPSVEDGYLTWTNEYGLPNPDPVYINGKDGSSIISATINDQNHFIITLDTGEEFDCGEVNLPQILNKKDNAELPEVGSYNAIYILEDKSIWRWNSSLSDYECISRYYSPEQLQNDKHYTHKQNSASDTWTIVHNLGKYPSVTVVDSAGTAVIGEVTYDNTNQVTIKFTSAFSGKAYLN